MTRKLLAAGPALFFAAAALAAPAVALDMRFSPIPGNAPGFGPGQAPIKDDTLGINRADGKLFYRKPDGSLGTSTLLNALPSGRRAVEQGQGDDLTVQREAAANALTLRQKIGETISVTEYAAPDGTISANALLMLSLRSKVEGKSINVPGGIWRTSGTLAIDRSDETGFNPAALRPSIIGQGQGTTVWIYTGTGTAFSIKGGKTGQGQDARQSITGLHIVGPSATTDGSIGIDLDHVAWFGLDDVLVTNFDKGVNGIDVEYLRAYRSLIRFNKRGVTMTSRVNAGQTNSDPTSSDANSHSWIACSIGSNGEYGLDYTRPNGLNLIGTDVQGNGQSAANGNDPAAARPGFGLRTTNAGTQGGALLISGGYIESQGGVADVWLRQTDPALAAFNFMSYRIEGTGFTRGTSNPRTNSFIALDFIASSGQQSVSINAAFKNGNGTPSTGPAIMFIGEKKQKDIELLMDGSTYSPGEEVDEYMAYPATVTRPDATGGFAATADLVFTRRWRTIRVSGTINIKTFGSGGSAQMYVTLPAPIRAGRAASCSGNDLSAGGAIFAVIPAGSGQTAFITVGTDNRLLTLSCEYPT